MNWKVLALIASVTLSAGLNSCSNPASTTNEISPSNAPAASTDKPGDAMSKPGDAMSKDKSGDAMSKPGDAMSKPGDAMSKDKSGDAMKKESTTTKP